MRVVLQRVTKAAVSIKGSIKNEINQGLVILLGVHQKDCEQDIKYLTNKIAHLRIFEDKNKKMNHSLLDIGGEALVVSQFTLYGDCRKGRRPSFTESAKPEIAEPLYQSFCESLEQLGVTVKTGEFQAYMEIDLINDGPVTFAIDSDK